MTGVDVGWLYAANPGRGPAFASNWGMQEDECWGLVKLMMEGALSTWATRLDFDVNVASL
jgi:hypothetical protein